MSSINHKPIPLIGRKFVPYNPRPALPQGIENPYIKKRTLQIPAKLIGSEEMAHKLTRGELKDEGRGRICGECVNMYHDFILNWDRCRAKGFKRVHWEWKADFMPKSWTDPQTGMEVPAGFERCPFFAARERYSRR